MAQSPAGVMTPLGPLDYAPTGGGGSSSPGTSLALGALSAVSMITTMIGQRAQASYAADVARGNSRLASVQADSALAAGAQEEARSRMRTREVAGAGRASSGAQGVNPNSGSAAKVEASTRYIGALDEMTIRNNAALKAWGYKVESANYKSQADMDIASGDMGVAQTFLTGGASFIRAGKLGGLY